MKKSTPTPSVPNLVQKIKKEFRDHAKKDPTESSSFFKTRPGEYASQDKFLNLRVPALRKILKAHLPLLKDDLPFALKLCSEFLESAYNEERLFALLVLVELYSKNSEQEEKEKIIRFFLKKKKYVNNWNLVDSSVPFLLGAYFYETTKRDLLFSLAQSANLWERRMGIVSTLFFIRKNEVEIVYQIAKILLENKEKEDLIHKATGWMLREAGKKNVVSLRKFLDIHGAKMPRTMLRYSIEKFPPKLREYYLLLRDEKILQERK